MTASLARAGRGVWIGLGATAAAVAVLLAAGALQQDTLAGVAKMTASTAFIATAIAAGGLQYAYGRTVLVALFFSWWGDFFLIRGETFLFGLIAFFLGHVFFGIAFLVHGVDLRWIAGGLLALMVIALPIFFWLNPHLNTEANAEMKIPVYAYISVITLMVALSVGAYGRGAPIWVPLGALLFYFSDICVARERFVVSSPVNPLLGLPLYFGAQMVFAYSVAVVRKAPETVPLDK